MNAAEFLSTRGRKLPTHPIKIMLMSREGDLAEADAVLMFIPDRLRLECLDRASESLAKLNTKPDEERKITEETYFFIQQIVKQVDNPMKNFFETVDQAKSMLMECEVYKIKNEYDRYQATNFPAVLTAEEAGKISEDARNFLFADLLKSYGYWPILRALPFLATKYGAFQTPTSSPTPSSEM